jgi:hypothetical protein
MNTAEAAIERNKEKHPNWQANVRAKMRVQQGLVPEHAAPLTNLQRATRITYVAGCSGLTPLFVELLDRLDTLAADNHRAHARIADLELVNAEKSARRKTA